MSVYLEGIMVLMGVNILMAFSAYIIMATGQLSLGNAGFMAIGAYCSGYFTVTLGWPLLPSLLVGAGAAGLVGIMLGFPVLRLQGIYLVLATLAFGEMVRAFFINFEPTGGAYGMRGLFGTTLEMTVIFVLAIGLFLWLLEHSRLGRAYDAVNADPNAAASAGLNVRALKVSAFGIGAAIAGVAGGFYAHYYMYIEPGNFTFLVSAMAVLFVILGGMETFWGALLGAIIFSLLPELLRFVDDWRLSIYGALLIGLIVVRPSGLITRDLIRRLTSLVRRAA